jgi:imidazolonepropionase-like amidohydrolase
MKEIKMLVLKNCKLINALTEGVSFDKADIFIKDDVITRIEPSEKKIADKELKNNSCECIDLNGKTVLPGFIDLHIHFDCSGGDILQENITSDAYRALQAANFAKNTLSAGFTTVRDMGARNFIDIALRDAINDGLIKGPRLYVSGHMISPTQAGNDFFANMYREADGPFEARKAAREQLKAGADQVKCMGTGAIMNPGGDPKDSIYEMDELKEIVRVAKSHDTYVAGHNHAACGIKNAIIAGVKTIEHASLVDDECIQLLKNEESYIIPTLSVIKDLSDRAKGSSAFTKKKAQKICEKAVVCLKKAYAEGLKLGFATDQGCGNFHGDNAMEFIYRHEMLGMKPLDILIQATRHSAEIIGIDNIVGTIKVGKIADLVVIDGNPLEDISLMKKGIHKVVHNGEIL